VPWVDFANGQRKDDVMHEHLERFTGTEGVLFIGRAQEKTKLFRTERRRDAIGDSYPWIVPSTGLINHFYLLAWTPISDGFAAVADPAALQAICGRLDAERIDALLGKWLPVLPYPFTAADRAAGYRYELSILQAEFSLTQMLDRPVSGRMFFEQVIRDNLDIGRPDQVALVFDRKLIRRGHRPTPGPFRTRVITEGVTPSLYVYYKHTRIKQYHKQGRCAPRPPSTTAPTSGSGNG
jgi:hypothetical protein